MDKMTELTSVVTEAMQLEFVDDAGDALALDAEFVYDPNDPYATTAVFKAGTQEVRWTFGRDLLIDGLYEPTGDGDVHVWPCLSSQGAAVVIIELSSPDGEVLLQATTRDITRFVDRMTSAVPRGAESHHVDVDVLLGQLFA
jgi:hypothetical protein